MQGPMIAEICGMQPEAMLFSKNILPMAEVTTEPFLNARAGGVVETDHRHAEFARGLNDVSDFLRVGRADAAGQYRAVLGVNVNRPAVDFAKTGDDTVGGLSCVRAMPKSHARRFRQHEFFDEGAGIEQFVDALTSGEIALVVQLGSRFRIARGDLLFQAGEFFF